MKWEYLREYRGNWFQYNSASEIAIRHPVMALAVALVADLVKALRPASPVKDVDLDACRAATRRAA